MGIFRGPNIVRDGLILNLDVASPRCYNGSNSIVDLSGRGNNGTMGGSTFSSDNQGIISLDGTDDRIEIPDSNNDFDFGAGDYTINCWVNPSYDSTYPHLFTLNDQYNFSLKAVRFDNSEGGKIYVYQGYSVTFGNSFLTTDEWQMITLTREGQVHKLYKNGVLSDTVTDSSGPKNITATTAYIGWGWASEYTPQKRGPIQVYNTLLSGDQVLQNFNAHKERFDL
jgi:hypothetical protein